MRLLAAIALLALGCGGSPSSTIDAAIVDGSRDAPAVADAIGAYDATPPCTPVLGEPDLEFELFTAGLARPIHVVSPPGDRRLFVVEQYAGTVRVVSADGVVAEDPVLDIGAEVGAADEQGLLGLAFHPAYADNRRFFVSFARASDNALVIEQWRMSSADPGRAEAGDRKMLLTVPKTRAIHQAGHLEFGRDGLLYISVGDDGPQGDPDMHAQDLSLLLGKILRVDIDGGGPYAIPSDNPFVGVGRGEILAYGLRNPWTFSIDPATGHLYLADVGFQSTEEIDVIPHGTGGQNFGWPMFEGSVCPSGVDCDATGLTPPVFEYGHSEGCAVSGGAVYRGCAMPGHHGKFFFSDYCGRWLRSFVYADAAGRAGLVTLWPNAVVPGQTPSIGVGPEGELYATDYYGGALYKLVPK